MTETPAPEIRADVVTSLEVISRALLERTRADRTTIRLDVTDYGFDVDRAAAEACAGAMRPISGDASLDQRALDTVRWLEANRTMLVQPSFTAPPYPPSALLEQYGVAAQMLGPLESGGAMIGWISVHSAVERGWTPGDVAALGDACTKALAALGLGVRSDERTSW